MAFDEYDAVFIGGGLAAMLLLNELRSALPRRVAVVDPLPPSERPPVHWSYWSSGATPYDRFAVGVWRWARVADAPPEPIAPFALRLVRSTDVLAPMIEALKDLPIERLRTTARSIVRRGDGLYEVVTDAGSVRACWVFDSACGVAPAFPSPHRPRAVVSGTGVRVEGDRPVFDARAAINNPIWAETVSMTPIFSRVIRSLHFLFPKTLRSIRRRRRSRCSEAESSGGEEGLSHRLIGGGGACEAEAGDDAPGAHGHEQLEAPVPSQAIGPSYVSVTREI